MLGRKKRLGGGCLRHVEDPGPVCVCVWVATQAVPLGCPRIPMAKPGGCACYGAVRPSGSDPGASCSQLGGSQGACTRTHMPCPKWTWGCRQAPL